MKKPGEGSRKTAPADPGVTYNSVSIDLSPTNNVDVRAITDALKQLHITHSNVVSGVISFLRIRPFNDHMSTSASFKGDGGREVLEARAYQGRLTLRAPPPEHLNISPSDTIASVWTLKGVPNKRAELNYRIKTEIPDVDMQLRQINEQIGIYHRNVADDEKILLTTKFGDKLEVTGSQLRRAGLIVNLPRRGAPPPRAKPTAAPPRNRKMAIQNAIVLIDVLQQVVDYKHRPGENDPPSDLWVNDREHLDMLRELLEELKKLNAALQAPASKGATARASINFTQSAQKFLDSAAVSAGKAVGPMMVTALAGSILYFSGLNIETVTKFFKAVK